MTIKTTKIKKGLDKLENQVIMLQSIIRQVKEKPVKKPRRKIMLKTGDIELIKRVKDIRDN